MNFDELKSLMEDFDPAKLLPDLDSMLGKMELALRIAVLVGPLLLFLLGLVYLIASPKEANYRLGYRCFFGMGSVGAWRFTQRLAGIVWGGLGLILTAVMFFYGKGFSSMDTDTMLWSAVRCILWEVGLVIISILAINITIAFLFDRKGNRRWQKKA